jgi:ATP-dependent exoDNAse (exonuclease V) beta subunit
MAQQLNWCRQQLLQEGIQNTKADAIIELTSAAIENCLESEQGRWILADHEDAECEYAITAVLKEGGDTESNTSSSQTKSMKLDRTFVENGIRWIIDYKTSRHAGGDLQDFFENEAKRYKEQLQGYKKAIALTDERPIKTALYFPLFDHLQEVK